MGYIYRHVRHDNNEVFYIGISLKDDPKYRRAFSKCKRSSMWNSIVAKTNYDVHIIMEGLTDEETKEKEKEFIKIYGRRDLGTGTLCNFTSGGEGVTGRIVSAEERMRTSKRMKGKNHPNWGKKMSESTLRKIAESRAGFKHSDEFKEKMSERTKGENNPNYGKSASEEVRNKISASRVGKKASEETKAKMSAAKIGRKHTEESLNKMRGRKIPIEIRLKNSGEFCYKSKLVIDKETGIFYVSAREAYNTLSLKISERRFRSMVSGKIKNTTSCVHA